MLNQCVDINGFQNIVIFKPWGSKAVEKGQGMGQEGRREVRSPLGNVQSGCRSGQGQGQVAGQSILAFPPLFSLRSSDGKHHVFIFYFMYVCMYLFCFILFYLSS